MHMMRIRRTSLPTLLQKFRLSSNVRKSTNNLLVTIIEGKDRIRNVHILTEFPNKLLRLAQIVSRDTRVQVVNSLELKTTMEKVQPRRAVDIHSSAKHLLGERFQRAKISSGHSVVRQRNLHMQRRSHHMRDENENDTAEPSRNATPDNAVSEPNPEEDVAGELEPAVPPARAVFRSTSDDDVLPAKEVEVEAAEE